MDERLRTFGSTFPGAKRCHDAGRRLARKIIRRWRVLTFDSGRYYCTTCKRSSSAPRLRRRPRSDKHSTESALALVAVRSQRRDHGQAQSTGRMYKTGEMPPTTISAHLCLLKNTPGQTYYFRKLKIRWRSRVHMPVFFHRVGFQSVQQP